MNEDLPITRPEREPSEMHSIGTMQGLPPGNVVHHVGLLDLRRTSADRIAQVREMHTVDVLLIEEEMRVHLRPTNLHHIGSILMAAPEERVLVTPQLDLSRTGMEGLATGQKIVVMGNVFFRPDVPPALVAEKIESLRVFGTLIACAGVHGVLLGKIQILNGVTVALPDEVGPVVRALGETRLNPIYLAGLPDGATYINIGKTQLDEGLPAEALWEKVAAYYNLGETVGPKLLLAAVQSRCALNLGSFRAG